MIELHPQLQKDCILLGEFSLCALLLNNDANYPWFILIPMRKNITELHQLNAEDQQQFLKESMLLSRCLQAVFKADKINIAALGNVVPQLHIHHIARFKNDASWPSPVWGAVPALAYDEPQYQDIKAKLSDWFGDNNNAGTCRYKPS